MIKYYKNNEKLLEEAADAAKTRAEELPARIAAMQAEIKSLHHELESLKAKAAKEAVGDVMDSAVTHGEYKLLAVKVPGTAMNGLRDLADELMTGLGEGGVVLASDEGGKVNLVAKVSDKAMKSGAHAGNLIKEIAGLVGGGGGGRPNMAQAGGKNPAGIESALEKAIEVLKKQLG